MLGERQREALRALPEVVPGDRRKIKELRQSGVRPGRGGYKGAGV